MNRQKGAALIVVLSLLTISLMVGLSSMQSSQIDERLAGNYKAQALAQMGAEEAASEGFEVVTGKNQFSGTSLELDELGKLTWDEFNNNGNFDGGEDPEAGDCTTSSCYYRYVKLEDKYYIVAMGGVDEGAVSVSEPVLVKLLFSGPVFGFEPEATVTCIGSACSFVPGSGKSGPAIDGTDRKAEGKTTGANRPDPIYDENDDVIFVPAVIMADMGSSIFDEQGNGKGKGKGGGIVGDEIYNAQDYNVFKEDSVGVDDFDEDEHGWDATKSNIQTEITNTIDNIDDYENVFYAGEGETVSPGSAKGVVVVNGGTLSLGGSDKFTGLVIMKGGNIESSGTPAIVGAVIGENFGFTGNGNPTVLYSSEAVGDANNDSGGAAGGSGPKPDIDTWN